MTVDKIYGVYYYQYTGQTARVRLFGMYSTLELAKEKLSQVLPNYRPNGNNPKCATGDNGLIGWINEFVLDDDIPYRGLSCEQPHSAVYLFDDEN